MPNPKLEIIMTNELQKMGDQSLARHQPTTLDILQTAIAGGVTPDSVGVVERIIALRREEIAAENKSAFNRDFFKLRKEIATLHFYTDIEAKNESGKVMYVACSEKELSGKLEPVLMKHGFSMMFGQRAEADRTTAVITLIHESGHEETREFTVRQGSTNRAKDASQADAGSTTTAWRHLVIKMFGLKSRISDEADPRVLGENITPQQAEELQHRAKMVNAKEFWLLKMGGVTPAANPPTLDDYKQLKSGSYLVLENFLAEKERSGK
jgi:hypothetical protein